MVVVGDEAARGSRDQPARPRGSRDQPTAELKCSKWHDAQSPGRANESARAEGDTVTLAVGIDAYRERRATVARVAASAKNEPITATMKSAHGA